MTDASEWGWGAISWNGYSLLSHQEPWGRTFQNGKFSAHAEPEAILRALRRFISPGEVTTLYTDHEAMKYAAPKGYAHRGW